MQNIYEDNLLAEAHFRYKAKGGIAYNHIADTYVALFSTFMPCGLWEAVEIIEGLLKNDSDIQPHIVHADTQGQSTVVFGIRHYPYATYSKLERVNFLPSKQLKIQKY